MPVSENLCSKRFRLAGGHALKDSVIVEEGIRLRASAGARGALTRTGNTDFLTDRDRRVSSVPDEAAGTPVQSLHLTRGAIDNPLVYPGGATCRWLNLARLSQASSPP
jgi:hypothetical protein